MKETYMARQGYKYYIYIQPGHIEYFQSIEEAAKVAEFYDVEIKECF